MKWRVKLLYMVTFVLFAAVVAAMALLTFYEPEPERSPAITLTDEAVFRNDSSAVSPSKQFLPRTSITEVQKFYSSDQTDPAGKVHEAAERILRCVLPPGSWVEIPGSLQITQHNSAVVSGLAVTPESTLNNMPEKRFRYQITVNFTPDGNCEAQFPQFTLINSLPDQHPEHKSQQ